MYTYDLSFGLICVYPDDISIKSSLDSKEFVEMRYDINNNEIK